MNIWIVNDDGINAKGIKYLCKLLNKFGNVTVIAPSSERSGYSSSITTKEPIQLTKIRSNKFLNEYMISGTPADCIKVGIQHIKPRPDIVFSGINVGLNIGKDIFYSGTVGAAREAVFEGIPSVAVSAHTIDDKLNFEGIVKLIEPIIKNILESKLPNNYVLNINIPEIRTTPIKGVKIISPRISQKATNYKEIKSLGGTREFLFEDEFIAEGDKNHEYFLIKNGYIVISPIEFLRTPSKKLIDYLSQLIKKDK